MNTNSLEEELKALIKKADVAQQNGNIELMREYDRKIDVLKAIIFENFNMTIESFDEDHTKTL